MCGIVGYVGSRDALPILIEGLSRLEYRGYDSAGVTVLSRRRLRTVKTAGRVADLSGLVPDGMKGSPGIAHTRWATHGVPNDVNAHPHLDEAGKVAVVHNGILDNASELRAKLAAEGVTLVSDTDTEVLAHLIAASDAPELVDRVRQALSFVQGTYGIAVMHADVPDQIVVACNGSPVVLGVGEKEMYVASDVAALVPFTRQVVTLDDGEIAVLGTDGYRTTTWDARTVAKSPTEVAWDAQQYALEGHVHYMHKEITEQPAAVDRTLRGRLDERFSTVKLGGINMDARQTRKMRRVQVIGCGSAFYAGEIGAQMIEELARIPASAEPASEFRYRNPVIDPDTLYVAVSQSGETYDTLAAVHELKRKGAMVLGVVNVVGSAIARTCDGGIYLHAGPEVCVASTKAFTSTTVALALLALQFGRVRDLSPAQGQRIIEGLRRVPGQIEEILTGEDHIASLAAKYARAKSMLFVGRVRGYPVAREAAQKLKEISYIHAEAYPASELKHGPLALVEPDMPTVAFLPSDELREKNLATLAEIRARGGPVIAVAHEPVDPDLASDTILVPQNELELDPILLGIPMQLFAYHAALELDRDIDKPRNLAKSVTVE